MSSAHREVVDWLASESGFNGLSGRRLVYVSSER